MYTSVYYHFTLLVSVLTWVFLLTIVVCEKQKTQKIKIFYPLFKYTFSLIIFNENKINPMSFLLISNKLCNKDHPSAGHQFSHLFYCWFTGFTMGNAHFQKTHKLNISIALLCAFYHSFLSVCIISNCLSLLFFLIRLFKTFIIHVLHRLWNPFIDNCLVKRLTIWEEIPEG